MLLRHNPSFAKLHTAHTHQYLTRTYSLFCFSSAAEFVLRGRRARLIIRQANASAPNWNCDPLFEPPPARRLHQGQMDLQARIPTLARPQGGEAQGLGDERA